jgi:riboflavin synthase
MFNGLIEAVGAVTELVPIPAGFRIRVATPLAVELGLGESIAVNGVCLTVIETDVEAFHSEISPETARVTALDELARGKVVNLERSMRADARVGGHFVQGHVDATGCIEAIRNEADFHRITLSYPPALVRYLVGKGSVAVDGISLTVAELSGARFDVQIVPFTWEHTNLSHSTVGGTVNLECDIIGKYIIRSLDVGERSFVWPHDALPEDQNG